MSFDEKERDHLQKIIWMREDQIKEERAQHEKERRDMINGTAVLLAAILVFSFLLLWRAEQYKERQIRETVQETIEECLYDYFGDPYD